MRAEEVNQIIHKRLYKKRAIFHARMKKYSVINYKHSMCIAYVLLWRRYHYLESRKTYKQMQIYKKWI